MMSRSVILQGVLAELARHEGDYMPVWGVAFYSISAFPCGHDEEYMPVWGAACFSTSAFPPAFVCNLLLSSLFLGTLDDIGLIFDEAHDPV